MNPLDGKLHDYATQRTRRDERLARALLWASVVTSLSVFGVLAAWVW